MSGGLLALGVALAVAAPGAAQERSVQGVIPRAQQPIVIDGKLSEWAGSFQMPVNAGHVDWPNRAAVWSVLWDAENLYVGLRCLDQAIFNSPRGIIPGGGDGVEFYLDVRPAAELGGRDWTPGTLHLFYAPATNDELKARVQLRGGIPAFKDVRLDDSQAASSKTADGYELEFKLPWKLLPGVQPAAGREIGLDLELSSGDGAQRVDRCWVFSGVAAVRTPSVLGRMKLVDRWDPASSAAYAGVLFPAMVARSHTPDPSTGKPVTEPAFLAIGISPTVQDRVEKVELTASGRALPMTGIRTYGPGWRRIQACLIGFTNPQDDAIRVRVLGKGGEVIAERDVPLIP